MIGDGLLSERTHLVHEIGQLLRRFVIATEQDQPAYGRFPQQLTIRRRQAETIDVQHHRSE
jgi:hypothetical protein